MHVPDGFLSPQITIPAYAVWAPLWAWAARRHFGRAAVESLPVIGTLTALAFVIQTIMIPVPGGTSTHLVGVTLLALLYHPLVAFVCESLVLLVQALFFGAGGVTVLGVNALAMGLLGPLAGWLAWKALHRVNGKVAVFVAAYASIQVATLAVAGALGLQHALSPRYFPLPVAVVLPAMLVPSLTAAGLAEGAYTVFALSLLRKANLRGVTLD
ncbi:energy-coupling factor ABC transporter permease [Anaeromyxobacter oryzisoli]|uniref:energy-coupling factor ABC transporter permease n=1 Tax=Anaeromyxobacter oryzisoli TaxID=2925408 RepID=UPI001F5846C7|nr:energy-coupling factor ABC transporter permease [Anaeromyxobacter sp. SG63]